MKKMLVVGSVIGLIMWLTYVMLGVKVYHVFEGQQPWSGMGIKCENGIYYFVKGGGIIDVMKDASGQPLQCTGEADTVPLQPHSKKR